MLPNIQTVRQHLWIALMLVLPPNLQRLRLSEDHSMVSWLEFLDAARASLQPASLGASPTFIPFSNLSYILLSIWKPGSFEILRSLPSTRTVEFQLAEGEGYPTDWPEWSCDPDHRIHHVKHLRWSKCHCLDKWFYTPSIYRNVRLAALTALLSYFDDLRSVDLLFKYTGKPGDDVLMDLCDMYELFLSFIHALQPFHDTLEVYRSDLSESINVDLTIPNFTGFAKMKRLIIPQWLLERCTILDDHYNIPESSDLPLHPFRAESSSRLFPPALEKLEIHHCDEAIFGDV